MPVLKDTQYDAPLSLEDVEVKVDTPLRAQNRALEVSLAVGENPSKIYDNPPPFISSAKQVSTPDLTVTQQQLAANNVDPDEGLRVLSEQAQKITETLGTQDFHLEGSLTYGDPRFSPAATRAVVNLQIAAEEMESARRSVEEDTSWFGYATDFVDRYLFRQIPIGAVEDISLRTTRKGSELFDAAQRLPPDEYREYIKSYIEELKTEGVFKTENWFALSQGIEELEKRGFDPTASLTAAGGVFDLVTAPFAGKLVTRITSIKGPKAGGEAVEQLSKNGEALDPEVLNEAMPSIVDPIKGTIKPTKSYVDKVAEDNTLVQKIEGFTRLGSFGRRATEEETLKLGNEIKNSIAARIDRTIADFSIEQGSLGSASAVVKLGRVSDGTPFATNLNAAKQAKAYREKGLVTSVEPVDPSDLNKGWYTVVREPIDTSRVGRELDLPQMNFVARNIARAVGSTRLLDDPALNTLAMMSESAKGILVREAKPYLKNLEGLSVKEQDALNSIVSELRDGQDSFMRTWYTPNELKDKWKTTFGEEITQKQEDAFYSLVTLSDAGYILQAENLVKNYVRHGYKAIEDGKTHWLAQPAKEWDQNAKVLDMSTGVVVRASEIQDGVAVWRTTKPVQDGVDLVIRPKGLRNIEHRHALAYNAGGARVNPHANFFIVAGTKNNRGTALLTAFSQKQAQQAVDELSNIRKQILTTGRPLASLTNDLDEIILKNNTWNPSIENTQDLIKWAQESGWDGVEEIVSRGKDSRLEEAGDLWDNVPYEFYARANLARSDQVLMEFGGGKTFNYSPVKGIVDQLSNAFNEYAFRNYTESAKVSFVKAALKVDKLPNSNLDQMFLDALDTLKSKPVTTAQERALIDFANIIQRRSHVKSEAMSAMERAGQELSEFVFDNFKLRVKPGDPSNALLRLGFQSAFGFGNVSQFIMQGSQIGSIVAISPRAGLQAASTVPAFRLALYAGSDEAARRFGKLHGWTVEETKEVFSFFRSTGRELVESDAVEKNIGPGFGISGFNGASFLPTTMREGLYRTSKVGRATLDAGLIPFREGEKFSRYTSILTAIIEYKARNPGANILSDGARAFITNREQRLTFDMTTASRAAFQTGLMRLPTQWLGYSFRAMEAVAIGRDLSKAERIRLGFFLSMMGGLAGFGSWQATDDLIDWLGVEPDSPGVAALKYGVFDAMISYGVQGVTDSEFRSAMGSRLAPLSTFFELYQKITEDKAYEVLGGPSTEIMVGATRNVFSAIGNLYSGRYLSAVEDVERVARTASGIDNIMKARGILEYNVYRSKTGSALDFEFDDVDAYMAALGISNFKIVEYWDQKGKLFRSEQEFRKESRDLQNRFKEALDIINNGDEEYGVKLIKELEAKIVSSGWTPAQQVRLRRTLKESTTLDSVMTVRKLMEQERDFNARVIESFTNRDNN